jgi:hypothetical protein
VERAGRGCGGSPSTLLGPEAAGHVGGWCFSTGHRGSSGPPADPLDDVPCPLRGGVRARVGVSVGGGDRVGSSVA